MRTTALRFAAGLWGCLSHFCGCRLLEVSLGGMSATVGALHVAAGVPLGCICYLLRALMTWWTGLQQRSPSNKCPCATQSAFTVSMTSVPAGDQPRGKQGRCLSLLRCSCPLSRGITVPAGIRAEVDKLDQALRLFSSTLEAWLECQKNWLFLESIFSASDIQRQLPAESKAFVQVGPLRLWPPPASIPAYMPQVAYFWRSVPLYSFEQVQTCALQS